jgi:hypothetical protein
MQQAKSLFDKLVVVGHPMSLEDFNLYVFRGLRGEFKDLVTSLITKAEPLLYADLHSHLLTHEFLHNNSLQSLDATASLLPSSLLSNHLCCQHHSPLPILLCLIIAQTLAITGVVLKVIGIPTATATLTRTGANLLQTGSQTISSRTGATPAVASGRDSSMFAANCAPVLVTQLPIVPNFTAVPSSPLLTLLLGMFLL